MAKDYQRLWKDTTGITDEAKAVRALAAILTDKEGRAFISHLDHKDVQLCIEILDYVGDDFLLLVFALSNGFIRASQNATSKSPRSRFSSLY
jgi:hypothetical protein